MLLDHPAAVVVIVVGPGGDAGPPAVEFVERVMAGLAEHGVDACHALWTESTAAGSRWRCYGECGCTGLVPPSSTSPLMAAARAEGRVVRADRSELERLVAPLDERVLRRREALLDAAVDAEAEATFAAFADLPTRPRRPPPAPPSRPPPLPRPPPRPRPRPRPPVAPAPRPLPRPAAPAPAAPRRRTGPCRPLPRTARRGREGGRARMLVGRGRCPQAATRLRGGAVRGAPAGERWLDPRTEVIEGIAVLDAALDAAQEALRPPGVPAARRAPAPARRASVLPTAPPGGGGDGWLDDERVVALTRALQIPVVRDAAVAACTGSRPAAAAALWAALARGTPDPEAAEPAALLALTGLLQGDGALANVALQRAEAAWPGHHLTETLRGLAAAGIRPSELRACLDRRARTAPGSAADEARRPRRGRADVRRGVASAADERSETTDDRRTAARRVAAAATGRRDGHQPGSRDRIPLTAISSHAGAVRARPVRRRGGAG